MECSLEEQVKAYEKWEVEYYYLLAQDIEFVQQKVIESKVHRGETATLTRSYTKEQLISMMLPNVSKPKCSLSYQRHSQNPDVNTHSISVHAPPSLTEDDLYYTNHKGKLVEKTIPMLRELLIPRNLLLGGRKEDMQKRLLEYNPASWRPKGMKGLEIYQNRPLYPGKMRDLYDLIKEKEEELLLHGDNCGAGKLQALQPHIMQHYEHFFNYHLVAKKNYENFVLHYKAGVDHWQGNHKLCYHGQSCPREGSLTLSQVVPIVKEIICVSASWVTEDTDNIWT
jgi:hypothetical protein